MCEYQSTLPKSMRISASREDFPFAHGDFADVYIGEYESSQVAVKVIRIFKESPLTEIARVDRFIGSCLGIPYLHCMLYRISAEKLLFGDIYGTPTSYPWSA